MGFDGLREQLVHVGFLGVLRVVWGSRVRFRAGSFMRAARVERTVTVTPGVRHPPNEMSVCISGASSNEIRLGVSHIFSASGSHPPILPAASEG
ncbi:hypothetical protein GCM10022206_55860 [Streptomyces chiangmaiensis]